MHIHTPCTTVRHNSLHSILLACTHTHAYIHTYIHECICTHLAPLCSTILCGAYSFKFFPGATSVKLVGINGFGLTRCSAGSTGPDVHRASVLEGIVSTECSVPVCVCVRVYVFEGPDVHRASVLEGMVSTECSVPVCVHVCVCMCV